MYDGRFVAAPVSPDVLKILCDDVDVAGGWLHERGPAGVEVSRDRRRRQNFSNEIDFKTVFGMGPPRRGCFTQAF